MSKDIEKYIEKCGICQRFRYSNQKEPLLSHAVAERPWQNISADIFETGSKIFLVIIDSFSNWIEVEEIYDKSAQSVIWVLKNVFSRLGAPDVLLSDNVPFNSNEVRIFATNWNFNLNNSSPRYPQSNGLAEKGVSIAKRIIKKMYEEGENSDIQIGLLEYRNTPLPALGYSPAQLLMGRILKSKLPTSLKLLKQSIINPIKIKNQIVQNRETQKYYYDRLSKPLKPLRKGENVMIKNGKIWEPGQVYKQINGRSYLVRDLNEKVLRRNRNFLNKSKIKYNNSGCKSYVVPGISNENVVRHQESERNFEESNNNTDNIVGNFQSDPHVSLGISEPNIVRNDIEFRTRSGRRVNRPSYLNDYIVNSI